MLKEHKEPLQVLKVQDQQVHKVLLELQQAHKVLRGLKVLKVP